MGRHARRSFPWALLTMLAVVALVLGFGYAVLNRGDDPSEAATTTTTGSSTSSRSGCADLRVAVAPQIAPVISELVRPAQAVCGKVTIEPTISADFVDDLSTGQEGVAPLWLSDAAAWEDLYRLRRADNSELPPIEVGPTIATSPVVLAVPKSLATAATTGPHAWIDGLASLPVSAADTRQSTPTALAFAAVWQQFANLPGGTDSVGDAFFEIVRSQVTMTEAFQGAGDKSTVKAFPASEQEIFAWNQGTRQTRSRP